MFPNENNQSAGYLLRDLRFSRRKTQMKRLTLSLQHIWRMCWLNVTPTNLHY
jgi:hypothetical protein